MNIAIFVDEQGHVAPLTAPGSVLLFTCNDGRWLAGQPIPFALPVAASLAEIRQQTLIMLRQLPACRHFVAREIHGALLAWLDGMGLTMWQFRGEAQQALEAIARQLPAEPAPETPTLPTQAFIQPGAESGVFYVDLLAALQCGGAHTSKHLLLPLLQRDDFSRLEVRCDHLPKWFSRLSEEGALSVAQSTGIDGMLRVVVSKNTRMS